MVQAGLAEPAARLRSWLFDVDGLVQSQRSDLTPFQREYAHEHPAATDFAALVEELRPTAIIGVSTVAKAFDRRVVEAMSRVNERPIIFPLSNPTSHAECSAEEAYTWSDGRAVVASGSPFAPVTLGDRTFVPGQGNNVYIFPAMGLAIFATAAKRVTDEMFIAAATSLAAQVTGTDLALGRVFPPQASIVATSQAVATDVARLIIEHDLAGVVDPVDIAGHIADCMYRPEYGWLDHE
jgi:malate dehydrogenase (oxaloacetate-decarboxylating)(NADP+)